MQDDNMMPMQDNDGSPTLGDEAHHSFSIPLPINTPLPFNILPLPFNIPIPSLQNPSFLIPLPSPSPFPLTSFPPLPSPSCSLSTSPIPLKSL